MKMGCFWTKEMISMASEKFVVKQHIAKGGFSTVDLVENISTKEKYALKRIVCHSKEDQKMARREINYYKKFDHPELIELLAYKIRGKADLVLDTTSIVYLVFPYYRNGTLHDNLIKRSLTKDYMDIQKLLRMFTNICRGVYHMHSFQPYPVAHRDLKTANVCLTDSNNPVIMDFGSCSSARIKVSSTQDAHRLQDLAAERCTLTYRAPELFHVESDCVIDERTDIWSLGCLLFAMCYFKSPYDIIYERGDSVNLAVISGTIPFPSETPYPESFHELIRYMLNTDPSKRPCIEDILEAVSRQTDLATKEGSKLLNASS